MPSFQIRLFGSVEIFRDGQPITNFRSQKTLVLLTYLLSQNRPLTRAHLAGLFWPDGTQQQALGHLRRGLHNLTKNLPGCLVIDRRTAAISKQAPAVVDIFQFQSLVQQNSIESMAEAAALYRAPFLEGVYDAESPELEEWIEQERERWQRTAIQLTRQLRESSEWQGRFQQALAYAQKLAALAPWEEENHLRLMGLYVKNGRRKSALAQYEICRNLLASDLGILPSSEITDFYDRIRQAASAPHNLRPSPTPFIGRQTELRDLQALAANPECRLITIVGAGGIGKTRLMLALCRQSVQHYLEGVWFISLADITTPEGVLAALTTALKLSKIPTGNGKQRLIDFLRHKELLLALDNFENLADASDLLTDILREAAGVTLLVTSRRPLALQEEWIFDLEGLSYPETESAAAAPGDIMAYEAVQFFNESARRRSSRFSLTANETAVIQICRLVQGVPLALEMAAAACREMSCAAVADGIRTDLAILQTPMRNVPERHRSVQAVFNHSWNLLDEQAQSAYLRLSLFQGSFTEEAAEKITDVKPNDIQRLAGQSLLSQAGECRYELHDLLRFYARNKLNEHPALANQIAYRHADYYIRLLVEKGENQQDVAHTAVTLDLGNITAAWEWAAGYGQWQLLTHSAAYLRDYYLDVGNPQEGIMQIEKAATQLEGALAVPDRQPTPPAVLYGRLLAHKAHLLVRSGQSDLSRQTARQVLSLIADSADPASEVEATYAVAFADFNQGNFLESRRLAETGWKLAQANGLNRLGALCLNQAGRCCLNTQDLDTAEKYFEKTAVLARTHAFLQNEISAQINLSLVKSSRGRYSEALALLQQALIQAERLGYHALTGIIYLNLGTVLFHQGDYTAGQAHYQAAQRAYWQSGNRDNLALSYHAQGSVALEMGIFTTAWHCFERALALYQETGAKHRQVIILGELSSIQNILGNIPVSLQHLQDGLKLASQIHQNALTLTLKVQAAWLAAEVGDLNWAENELAQVEALLPDNENVELQCLAYLSLCRLQHFRGDLRLASLAGEKALNAAREQEQRKLPICAVRLGYLFLEKNDPTAASRLFTEALGLFKERKQPHLAAEASAGLARAELAMGKTRAAFANIEAVLRFLDGPLPPNTLEGTQEPALVYLACHAVLQAAGDSRAAAILQAGFSFLQKRAAGLDEPWQRSFWESVPSHRALLTAVEKLNPPKRLVRQVK